MTNTAQNVNDPQEWADARKWALTNTAELLDLVRAFEAYLADDSRSERRRQVCLEQCRAALAKAVQS